MRKSDIIHFNENKKQQLRLRIKWRCKFYETTVSTSGPNSKFWAKILFRSYNILLISMVLVLITRASSICEFKFVDLRFLARC